MKQIVQRSTVMAVALMLTMASFALSAPKADRAKRSFTVTGRVLNVDRKERALLVKDMHSKKLYRMMVPKGAAVRVLFGRNSYLSQADFDGIYKYNVIQARCIRASTDHFARAEDGSQITVVTATP